MIVLNFTIWDFFGILAIGVPLVLFLGLYAYGAYVSSRRKK